MTGVKRIILPRIYCGCGTYDLKKKLFGEEKISLEMKKLIVYMGARHTFREVEDMFEKFLGNKSWTTGKTVLNMVREVGEKYENYYLEEYEHLSKKKVGEPAEELIVGVDGGYIHDWENKGHNYECLVAKVYNPEKVKKVSKDRYEIQEKSCCGTSKKDKSNFEKLLYRAALKQGYSERTTVYYLADGDRKLWELKELLFPYAYGILDWFHITKRITLIDNLIEEAMSEYLEKIKASLWYGKIDKALRMIAKFPYDKLQKHKNTISKKLNELKIYITSNREYIPNYNECRKVNRPISSVVAESTVEHIIAPRLEKHQKMQWTRQSAGAILQLRSAMASNEFDEIFYKIYKKKVA